ncbi:uncharacterized protein LOC129265870 [Lytechinus pictus]|uniref:uncharacterized protein LOC129265870 n=1 Tax=Lytechinus pictus TaxID=7653 RepID=UPI0030B9FB6C
MAASQYDKLREKNKKYPNIDNHYKYNRLVMEDTCAALYGIILQDIRMGKAELLKEAKFIQGRLYETLTYILERQGKTLDQVMMEFEHSKMKYLRSRTIVQPRIDMVLAQQEPQQQLITAIMIRKRTAGYEPDVRSVRSDMARLAYLILEKVFRFAFYIWIGTLEELRHQEMTHSLTTLCEAEGEIKNHLVLRKHTLVMPRIGKPIPSTFMTTLLVNKISPDFCVRLYRVEPESSMWDDREDDVTRLHDFYSSNSQLNTGYGMWGISGQISNVRNQVKKVRDYVEANLFDRARAMLMMARVMFTDLLVVKNLEKDDAEETDYLKHLLDELKVEIQQELEKREGLSTSESDESDD